ILPGMWARIDLHGHCQYLLSMVERGAATVIYGQLDVNQEILLKPNPELAPPTPEWAYRMKRNTVHDLMMKIIRERPASTQKSPKEIACAEIANKEELRRVKLREKERESYEKLSRWRLIELEREAEKAREEAARREAELELIRVQAARPPLQVTRENVAALRAELAGLEGLRGAPKNQIEKVKKNLAEAEATLTELEAEGHRLYAHREFTKAIERSGKAVEVNPDLHDKNVLPLVLAAQSAFELKDWELVREFAKQIDAECAKVQPSLTAVRSQFS
ncbi:MAG TPA: hypothetical protein VGM44_25195, partial [Polyangiaceae bacterium]